MLPLSIQDLWNGDPAEAHERYHLTLQKNDLGYRLDIEAPYFNDPKPEGPAGSFWQLWEYEVVELFIVGANGHYLEIECGPHGHYLVLQLDGVRSVVTHSMETEYSTEHIGHRWIGRFQIPLDWLPPAPHRINAFAIHGLGEDRRYLAHTALPGVTPDFHQPSQFRLSSLANMR